MTTQQYLAQLNVTMQQARDFFFDFLLSHTEEVYNICKNLDINNDMISEILQNDLPGLTGSMVSDFFTSVGYDGNDLGFNETVSGSFFTTGSYSNEEDSFNLNVLSSCGDTISTGFNASSFTFEEAGNSAEGYVTIDLVNNTETGYYADGSLEYSESINWTWNDISDQLTVNGSDWSSTFNFIA